MAEFPALPLWTDAYLADTHPSLTLEEQGCYILLLMAAWRRPGCSLPDDDKWFCRWLGIHGNKWNKLRSEVLQRFFTQDDEGNWHQKRLGKERDFVEKSRRNSKESAEKRWAQSRNSNDLGSNLAYAPTPTPIPIKKETPSICLPHEPKRPEAPPPVCVEPGGFANWYAAYPRKVGRDGALKAYRTALGKADDEEMLDGLQRARLAWEKAGTEARYIPHPATWLNRRGWADEDFQAGNGQSHIKADPFFKAAHDLINQCRENDDASSNLASIINGTCDCEPDAPQGSGPQPYPLGRGSQAGNGSLRRRNETLPGCSGNGGMPPVGTAESVLAFPVRAGRVYRN